MNAPLATPLYQPFSLELERDALGSLLLGYPHPDWATPEHFYAGQHRKVMEAVLELGASASLPSVASLLRDRGQLYTREMGPDRHSRPGVLSSVDLVAMVDGFEFSARMGWSPQWETLRELADRRAMLQALRRATVVLEHDGDCADARRELMEVMGNG